MNPQNCNGVETLPPKSFQEIAAEVIGNQLTIRMERKKNKGKRGQDQWEPPCACDIVEIKRPSTKEGPKIVNGGNNNQILFKVYSRTRIGVKEDPNYKPQTITYKVGECKGCNDKDRCRTFIVHPQFGRPGVQEIHSDHIEGSNCNILLLKVKKKDENPEQKMQNIELELRTPKMPCMHTSTPNRN
ncbi:uncharacterized protein LOC105703624 [Orussus abietinus]|uniref:uncharacterized protein LOC105703624 n=1 Tax=Orussus abietinus TaxID=222816 RepID=UPI00062675FA|nr:uncharacterized protein LOC105703624 [Orussus abietinus]